MVKALQADRKSQTRRTSGLKEINLYPNDVRFLRWQDFPDGTRRAVFENDETIGSVRCPYGKPGDNLWVRETFLKTDFFGLEKYIYRADGWTDSASPWKPSIHMPRIAARYFLEVLDIRLERLNDISNDDCIAEGIEPVWHNGEQGWKDYTIIHTGRHKGTIHPHAVVPFNLENKKDSFRSLIQSIHGDEFLKLNPWVWVIKFKKC